MLHAQYFSLIIFYLNPVQETVQTSSINILAPRLYDDTDDLDISTMADMMWGGVPFTIPSITAMKYISGAVKVQVNS